MLFLPTATQAEAEQLNAKALAFARQEQGALGSSWSPIFTDGARFAITYDDSVRDAFTAEELTTIELGTRVRLVDGVKNGTWDEIPA